MKDIMEKGILFCFLAALISGISVFLNGAAVKLSDPFVYTTLKNMGAVVFLVALVLIFKQYNEIKKLNKNQWKNLALIGIIGGSIPFLLFFWGLKLEGPAISSFIFRSLFIFAAIFGYFLLKEKITKTHLVAGGIILLGNILLINGELVFGFGHLLILAATAMWALEYSISRKALQDISPRIVMTSRMFFGSFVLLGFLVFTGKAGLIFALTAEQFQWLIITSLSLFMFLSFWYVSLKYTPVLQATTILALGGIITALLNLTFLDKAISPLEGLGFILIAAGVLIMVGLSQIVKSISGIKDVNKQIT